MLVPKHQQSSVTHFSLHQRIESDHMPLSFGVNCRHTRKEVVKNPYKLTSSTRYVWKEEKRQEYTCKLSEKLNSLDSTHKDVDEIVADLKDAILSSAANMKKKSRGENTRQSPSPWFDTECRQMKAATVSAFKIYLRKQTADNDNIYQRNKRNYKTLLKKKKRAHQKEKVRQLIHDKKKNPKKFWQELKWKEKSKEIGASQAELENHFRAVFSDKMNSENSQWVTYVRLFNEWWLANSNKTDEYLDEEITKSEVRKSISDLKKGKSPGPDNLLPEFFKCGIDNLETHITRIFNVILSTATYPTSWQQQLICPIFKKGDFSDPNNYRGICLMSIFSKIFLNIIRYRMENFCEANNILIHEQGGYSSGKWTIDNIFILQCHIRKALSRKRGHLYCLFVDYSKCFDSIDRNLLWYKLEKAGFSTSIVKLLMSIYSKVDLYVRVHGNVGEKIDSTIGLKQGCPLSTILFSLFTNDIVSSVGTKLNFQELFMLLFADDIVVFSEDAWKLRKMISNLEKYTTKWGLKVNLEKTKLIIFRNERLNAEGLLQDFSFKGESIEYVESYNYLGTTFHYSGKWKKQIGEAKSKGMKACFKLREKIENCGNLPAGDKLDLYKTCVQSTLLYGCEIWGTDPIASLETVQNSFAKYILKVRHKTPNFGALAELGLLPYKYYVLFKIIKYWLRIVNEKPFLLYASYNMLLKVKGNTWCKTVRRGLENLGFGNVWAAQGTDNQQAFYSTLLKRFKDTHTQDFDCIARKSPRLTLLHQLSTDPCSLSPYLRNGSHRTAQITKIRLSSHSLRIETGRWQKPQPIPREERFCELCLLRQIEDEYHFIMVCPLYETQRRKHLPEKFIKYRTEYNFINLLKSENSLHCNKLSTFIKEALLIRKRTLEN